MADEGQTDSKDLPIDNWDAQIRAIDDTIKTVEKTLADADRGIDLLIQKRGEIACHVQILWNRRHQLKDEVDQLRRQGEIGMRYR